MKNGYRVEYKSKVKQTYEIFRVQNGFDMECFITDFSGNIEEYWIFDHENDLEVKVDHTIVLALSAPMVLSEIRHAIKEFEAAREDQSCDPWELGTLLLKPYNTKRA